MGPLKSRIKNNSFLFIEANFTNLTFFILAHFMLSHFFEILIVLHKFSNKFCSNNCDQNRYYLNNDIINFCHYIYMQELILCIYFFSYLIGSWSEVDKKNFLLGFHIIIISILTFN